MGSNDGKQITGLPMAADTYLGKPLDEASEEEFVGLVAMIKAPNQYHPVTHPAELAERVARIQALLAGKCKPDGWYDTVYPSCAPSS
jgi:membrane peptidoglycan carboxypeptidase